MLGLVDEYVVCKCALALIEGILHILYPKNEQCILSGNELWGVKEAINVSITRHCLQEVPGLL